MVCGNMDVEVVPSPSYMDDLYDGSEEKVTTFNIYFISRITLGFFVRLLRLF